jgi:hypothetical protein
MPRKKLPSVVDADDIPKALERNTGKALRVAGELMDLDTSGLEPDTAVKFHAVRANVTRTVLSTALKAQEHALKRKTIDLLPQLLKRVEEERKKRLLE